MRTLHPSAVLHSSALALAASARIDTATPKMGIIEDLDELLDVSLVDLTANATAIANPAVRAFVELAQRDLPKAEAIWALSFISLMLLFAGQCVRGYKYLALHGPSLADFTDTFQW